MTNVGQGIEAVLERFPHQFTPASHAITTSDKKVADSGLMSTTAGAFIIRYNPFIEPKGTYLIARDFTEHLKNKQKERSFYRASNLR